MEKRKEQLINIVQHADKDVLVLLGPLIEHVVFLEELLAEIKASESNFIKRHPTDHNKIKPGDMYKQYKDLSQTYVNELKILQSALGIDVADGTSPLRLYLDSRLDKIES